MPATYAQHRAQLKAILSGWDMPEDNAEVTAEVLAWSDLHGVDSHGISMIPRYDELRRKGRVRMDARPRIVSQTSVSAVVDGGGGLGHVPAHFAMSTVIAKAKTVGMAAAVVRGSAHFGAAGFYTLMAANAGLVGMACTSASSIQVAPTFGKQARLGTDPWSFAVPSADGVLFLLDMATTTVAAGRIRNKANEKLPTPDGWLLDREGRPSNDPLVAKEKGGFLTSLGGTPENSSYKGYGLTVMVNILASCLAGATLITDPEHTKKTAGMDIGHFFMAIDPAIFRGGRRGDISRSSQGHATGRSGAASVGGRRSAVKTGRHAPSRRHSGRCRIDGAGPPDRAGRCGALAARLGGPLDQAHRCASRLRD
jgi:LDH2 family malate/lactate/ureidoglycolate dehydrogenase